MVEVRNDDMARQLPRHGLDQVAERDLRTPVVLGEDRDDAQAQLPRMGADATFQDRGGVVTEAVYVARGRRTG
ncbi:hypothetical protein [Pseudonocardia kongjuensis]